MKNWSLNAKFSLVVAILGIASISISVMGVRSMSSLNGSLDRIVHVTAAKVVLAKELESTANAIRNYEKVYILEDSEAGMTKIGHTLDNLHKEMLESISKYEPLADDWGKSMAKSLRDILAEWVPVNHEVRQLAQAGKSKEATVLARGKSRDLMVKFDDSLQQIVKRNVEGMQRDSENAAHDYASSRNWMIGFSIVAILIGLVLAYFILMQLSRAIDRVIQNLEENSAQVSAASQQIASSSEQLSQSSNEQAASLQESVASIEQMTSMVARNSENAKSSSEVSVKSSAGANKGKSVVQEMVQAIEAINASNTEIMGQIEQSNREISDITKVIAEIGNKTKVINDIVFQTKLLSFNASVEAARAGEHGKGFAVVAEEVGNLAQMSGNAAKEIASMLDESIQKVGGIVTQTKAKVERLISGGKEKVEAGTRVARECEKVLEEIVVDVSSVAKMAGEIATASEEQSQGIGQISKAMGQLDQATQENASTSEEAASAAEELSAQADSLKGVVRVLIETVKGAAGEPRSVGGVAPVVSIVGRRTSPRGSEPMKKAAGQDFSHVPSESDPRFKEV